MEKTAKFYRDREEFSDVTPLKQDANVERQVAKIAYSEAFIDAHDYVRALMYADERSERALELTADCLNHNPANYSVWEYRRQIIASIHADLNMELRSLTGIVEEHPKNYQVWHHRQWVVRRLCAENKEDKQVWEDLKDGEINFVLTILAEDSKNYHVWQYLKWAVDYFQVPYMQQYNLTKSLIINDVFNNSSWSFRFYVAKAEGLTSEVIDREVAFTKQMLKKDLANESAWNYLFGITNYTAEATMKSAALVKPYSPKFVALREYVEQLTKEHEKGCHCAPLLSFTVDIYCDMFYHELSQETKSTEKLEEYRNKVNELCDVLANDVDKVRKNYWAYRKRFLEKVVIE